MADWLFLSLLLSDIHLDIFNKINSRNQETARSRKLSQVRDVDVIGQTLEWLRHRRLVFGDNLPVGKGLLMNLFCRGDDYAFLVDNDTNAWTLTTCVRIWDHSVGIKNERVVLMISRARGAEA